MKAIMYHYVRCSNKDLPYFRYLDFENFKKQLDFFEEEYGFVSYEDFLELFLNQPKDDKQYLAYKNKILLTFDDGLKDHYKFVLPELKKRGLFGLFFIPTGVYYRQKALDVHRIHFIIGRIGGEKAFALAREKITELEKINNASIIKDNDKAMFEHSTYKNQDNDFYTNEFKKLFNYYIKYEFREGLLDSILSDFSNDSIVFNDLYMSVQELKDMQDNGMIIGSHSDNHFVFSKLDRQSQYQEINNSFNFLENINIIANRGGVSVKIFCYPYGGSHTYTEETKWILNKLNVKFSFDVNYRDIELDDILYHPQALPRYDCNLFEYGKASLG